MSKQEYTVRNAKPDEFGEIGREQNAAGFRLLFVDPLARGQGIGKLLTNECVRRAKDKKLSRVIIHTTMAMQTAWKMQGNPFRDCV